MTEPHPSASDSSHEVTLPGTGSVLGRYQVRRRLGVGGMGQVFAAVAEGSSEFVALKQITVGDPTLLVRFKQEFRSLADLPHPNLVRLGELVVLSSALAFYTMELVEGQSLIRWVRRGTPAGTAPNIARLCHAMRQLAAGVAHLHRAARVHRDLKPSNVLVTDEGRVVILDFGLVLELGERDARITATGQLVGTPAYMAPEQGTRDAIGPAVDLYALGVTLFECLTGCMPFVGPAIRVLLDKQLEPAPDPRELAEGIPDWLARLCRALLDARPEQRPSAEQLIAVLDEHVPAASTAALDDTKGVELIGRARELAELEQAFEQVGLEGVASLVRVIGPPGRGKTALVDRFLDDVRGPASVILRGRCHPRESVPYKGIDRVVDELAVLLRAFDPVEAAALRPRHVRELCELFPVLGGIWSEAGRRSVDQDPIARRRLGVGALREVLTRLGDEATLVVVIDDMQWADLDGFAVLTELLLPPEPPAVLLLLAYDREAGGPIVERLREPDALQGARTIDIELGPLSSADARALAEALIDARLVDDAAGLAEQLAADSHGEPLALVRAATVRRPVDSSEPADDELLRRILALSSDARELLELVCIADARLLAPLAAAALGREQAKLDEAVRELVVVGLMSADALEPGCGLELAGSRIGALVQVESSVERQQRLHAGLAEALAANEADPELIAGHFEAGGALDRAREFVTRAAHGANEALAFVRAEQLYRRALELLERSRSHGADAEVLELRLALAESLVNLARCREAADLYVMVADHSPPEQASKLRLRAAEQYSIAGWSQHALPLLRELFREAGERLPSTRLGAVWSFIVGQLQLMLHGRQFRVREPQDVATDLLPRFDLLYAALMALSRKDMLLSFALRPRTKLLALKAGEVTRLIAAEMLEAGVLMTLGRFERAAEQLQQAEGWARACDEPLSRAQVHAAWHFYHARLGQLDQAEARLAAVMACFEHRSGRGWVQGPALHNHALLLRQSGVYRRLLQSLPAWLSLLHDFGQRQHAALTITEEVLALAQTDQCEAARRSLERGRAIWMVEYYCFTKGLLNIGETWLLMAEGRWEKAHVHAQRNEDEQRMHGHARFKLPRTRVQETRLWAQLLHGIASHDAKLAPSERELRALRRCGLPQYVATAWILMAGRATLLGDHARARDAWREALRECETLSMFGLTAALCWRLADVEADLSTANQLRARARAYFEAEQIGNIPRFVALMTPAVQAPSDA